MSIQTSQKIARAPGGKLRLSAASYPVMGNAQSTGTAPYQSAAAYGASNYGAASDYRGINPELLATYRL